MKERFIQKRFNRSSVKIIEQANGIIAAYQAQGFTLTLRQLYYQFVSRDIIPNKQSEYKRLGSIINDARLAGLVDWNSIEDRTRNVRGVSTWEDPAEVIRSALHSYREDLWRTQSFRPEVWIEKDALVGVVEPVCRRWRVDYFACRGYSSQSEQYSAGKRFAAMRGEGIRPVVLHLGDHDPSGVDMTRDNRDRLAMFARQGVTVKRLALNMDQIEQYDPPPNPAKETDSRAAGYIEEYGDSSWELDALEPTVIDALIEAAITKDLDRQAWDHAKTEEEERKDLLQATSDNWDDVSDIVRKSPDQIERVAEFARGLE
ncbi:hypothetical protein LH464_04185 [Neorhizobium sp. T786]|uniref:hypothetical protein n=1 Tax=Pseudorhizobium xiangyangii TaxID=2883104 RepID=UPI001CFFC301|nr:hypothetical protein [Neorhizobium xiangyangii]MCB5201676.1 hypothetical protein [Neorhizobium xiangyangii]